MHATMKKFNISNKI